MREGRRVAIHTSSNKQKLIENMIQKQYDQLLEICEQTKTEVAHLSKDINETDFTRSLEIEKTKALIASIEQDIKAKKQDVYDIEIKNRYQQLHSDYETTKKEVAILENLLQNNSLDKADCVKTNHDYHLNGITSDEILTSNQHPEPKRERLNLRASTPSLNLSRSLESDADNEREEVRLERLKRLERLENIVSMLDKQTPDKTHRFDAEPNKQEKGSKMLEVSAPVPVMPKIPEAPVPAPITPKMPEAPASAPVMPKIPEAPVPAPVMPKIPEAPVPAPVMPKIPEAPVPAPVMPKIPEVPVLAPVMPKIPQPEIENKKQSKSKATKKKQPLKGLFKTKKPSK